jgi:hypothetical protein
VLAGDSLQIHISAHAAMHVPNIFDGRRPRVKSRIAASAPPGTQQYRAQQIVLDASPAGTTGTVTVTRRTNQFRLPLQLVRGYGKVWPDGKFHLHRIAMPCRMWDEVKDAGLYR